MCGPQEMYRFVDKELEKLNLEPKYIRRELFGKVYIPKNKDGRRLADLKYGYIHPCCSFLLTDIEIEVPPVK